MRSPLRRKTCTITNNDNAPALRLRKTVTNDNGGTAVVTAWNLTATGTGATPSNLSGATPVNSGASFKADTYTLAEDGGPSGYTASSWSCVVTGSDPPTPVTVTNSTVAIGLGADVTCTITNNDNAPALRLRKTVTNDNGGTAVVTAWNLTATGTGATPSNLSGATPVNSGASFKADTYTLAEDGGPSGYTASSWSCVVTGSDPPTPVTVTNSTVAIGLGADVTCTINNNDNAPALRLRKTVTNDNGGTAVVTAWNLTATGTGATPSNLSGATPVNSGASFKADTYTLAEDGGPSGYTASSWSCVVTGSDPPTPVTVTNSTVAIGVGADVTCTINNNDTKAQPAGATIQTWVLKDSIAITGIRAGAPNAATATVVFRLYGNANCTGDPIGSETDSSIVGGAAATSTGVSVTATGFYYWTAQYSGDDYNLGFTTTCGDEVTQIQALDAFGGGRNDLILPT